MKKRKIRRLQQSGINPTRFERGQVKFYLYLIPIAVIMALPILMIKCLQAARRAERLSAALFCADADMGELPQALFGDTGQQRADLAVLVQ